ncbi:MAG: doxorubicin biosynthesis enzyme DnrV [Gemmatimonadetes bacterium]|nr:doxorubicin biosynthesis enzyme DnrV [Gemmatimonadota bacterium]
MSSSTAAETRGRFVWHELLTNDTRAAEAFYKEIVGWKTSKMGDFDYTFWLAGDTPDTMVGGLTTPPPDAAAMGSAPSWLAYIEVPDADATITQAIKLGAKVLVPAKTMEQAGRFAVLQDPQGAVFAIITSAQPLAPETDPAPRQFSWHELATSDQPAAISFYQQIFGWEKKSEFDMGAMGSYYMFGRDRFTYGGIMKRPPEVSTSRWLHYVSVADSADAAAGRAQKAGGTVVLGPMDVPGGDRVAMLSDPQGAAFAVHSKGTAGKGT